MEQGALRGLPTERRIPRVCQTPSQKTSSTYCAQDAVSGTAGRLGVGTARRMTRGGGHRGAWAPEPGDRPAVREQGRIMSGRASGAPGPRLCSGHLREVREVVETAGAGPGWGAAGSGPARGAQEGRWLAGGRGERSFVPQVIAHCNPRAQTHTLNFRSLLGPSREAGAKPCRPRLSCCSLRRAAACLRLSALVRSFLRVFVLWMVVGLAGHWGTGASLQCRSVTRLPVPISQRRRLGGGSGVSQCLIDKPRPLPATQWKGAPQDQPRSPASAAWGNKPAGQRAPCWRLQTPGREMTQQGTGGGVLRMAARASPAYTQGRGLPALVRPVRHTHPQLSSALTGDSSGRPAPKQQPGGGQWAWGGWGGVSPGLRGGECWATGRCAGRRQTACSPVSCSWLVQGKGYHTGPDSSSMSSGLLAQYANVLCKSGGADLHMAVFPYS